MSRLSRRPIDIPPGVTVSVASNGSVDVKGKLGELSLHGNHNVQVTVDGAKLTVKRLRNTKFARSLEGTYVRRIINMLTGVSAGWQRSLELQGTGYRATTSGNAVGMELGFSHPISYQLPKGVKVETPAPNRIVVSGIDNVLIGQVAADLRSFRPPEPYKGKGVRLVGEQIITKEAKKK